MNSDSSGPFCRLESPSQKREDAISQAATMQIWGRAARGSDILSVKAYRRNLGFRERGVQFETPILPHGNGSPFEAKWYFPHTPGVKCVEIGSSVFAVLPITSFINRQL